MKSDVSTSHPCPLNSGHAAAASMSDGQRNGLSQLNGRAERAYRSERRVRGLCTWNATNTRSQDDSVGMQEASKAHQRGNTPGRACMRAMRSASAVHKSETSTTGYRADKRT